jgi:hypothetical protein
MTTLDLSYIRAVELPAARSRGPGELARAPDFTGTEPQAVAVGSQVVEFAGSVSAETRADLSNCLLLAQLAADKAAGSPAQDIYRWYDKYIEVLQHTGWRVTAADFQEQAISADGALVHKEIIPVVTAFLGPAARAASLVLQMLNSLNAMAQTRPWITLFQSESQSLQGAKFQIALVDRDAHGDAVVNLLSIGIEARQRITQVLFFKLSRQSTKLRKATGSMTMSPGNLAAVRDIVRTRVERHVADYVMNVAI